MSAIFSERTRTLKELIGVTHFAEPQPNTILKRVMVIDTETTGLNHEHDEIVEVAFNVIEFDEEGNFYRILFSLSEQQEPSKEIDPDAQIVTGYTKELLRGKKINWDVVSDLLKGVDVVTSFNAAFDRPFLEAKCPEFKNKFWACSMEQVPWLKLFGIKGTQERLLSEICGVYYNAHNATTDVDALCYLLSSKVKDSERTIFYALLKVATIKGYLVHALDSSFNDKDLLKANKYKWNSSKKLWVKETKDVNHEMNFLSSHGMGSHVQEVTGFNRFRG